MSYIDALCHFFCEGDPPTGSAFLLAPDRVVKVDSALEFVVARKVPVISPLPPSPDDVRIAANLRRTIELTELGLALRRAVIEQRDEPGKGMTQVMHEIRLAKEQAVAAEPILVRAFSDLITEFSRRGVSLCAGRRLGLQRIGRASSHDGHRPAYSSGSAFTRTGTGSRSHPCSTSDYRSSGPLAFQGISIWRIVGIRSGRRSLSIFSWRIGRSSNRIGAQTHGCIGALQVPMLSIEDLVILKMVAGRLQDRADLEKIRARQADLRVDWTYVERWKTTLGLVDR